MQAPLQLQPRLFTRLQLPSRTGSSSSVLRSQQPQRRSGGRRVACRSTIAQSLETVKRLKELLADLPPLSDRTPVPCAPQRFPDDGGGDRVGFVVSGADVPADSAVMRLPEELAVTRIDAEDHPLVGEIAAQSSELTALTLLLLAERAKGDASVHRNLLAQLPESTLTPLLWEDDELSTLLAGSPVLPEARQRRAALEQQWQALQEQHFSKDPARFPEAVFGKAAFMRAFSVVLGHAVYLPSAEVFALMPLASLLDRTGSEQGCMLDYDSEQKAAVLTTPRPLRNGTEVLVSDPRPNSELVLATGKVYANNPADHLEWKATLIQTDRYYLMKSQILESLGYGPEAQFPVFADRMPTQLLAYLRLARVQDPGLLAKVSFEQDVMLSDLNEYEILQILMGDCRDRLQSYSMTVEEEIKYSQNPNLGPKERLACKLRTEEKRIVASTMDAVRNKLAPIRGIPTKQGLQSPNQDILDVFSVLESIPSLPKNVLGGLASWAKGEQDPDWGKSKPKTKDLPRRPW